MSTLAVLLALGGATAFAASQLQKNSVGPRQLKKNAVTTAKIKNGAVTGTKIRLDTLGAVPDATHAATAGDAATLQGNDAAAFVHGDAQVLSTRRELQIGDDEQLLPIPGIGTLTVVCKMGTTFPAAQFFANNRSGGVVDQTLEFPGGDDAGTVPDGEGISDTVEGAGGIRMKLSTRTSPATIATLDLSKAANAPSPCGVFVQVIVGRG